MDWFEPRHPQPAWPDVSTAGDLLARKGLGKKRRRRRAYTQSGDIALRQRLLDDGADPFIPTENGDTALTAAGGMGRVEGVTHERSAKENAQAIGM